ncbi:hypothetical protein MRQ36_08455 [Micromonospora sp. R77]|uniref:hypothetical protein n=1 Tax=Micromonospora sp. R77 TaxID=2925836 RepID=UPI001F61A954|nr:hypothetical protein [Micromonospora sp. R77]MCI4062595.1 hypothetical protein [Micromonospora sp. R77]
MPAEDHRVTHRASSCYYYSIGLPLGEGQGDVPALLRHVATSIDDLAEHGTVEVAGLMYSDDEVNEYGVWPRMTVFYTLD